MWTSSLRPTSASGRCRGSRLLETSKARPATYCEQVRGPHPTRSPHLRLPASYAVRPQRSVVVTGTGDGRHLSEVLLAPRCGLVLLNELSTFAGCRGQEISDHCGCQWIRVELLGQR